MATKYDANVNVNVTQRQVDNLEALAERMGMSKSEALRYLLTMLPKFMEEIAPPIESEPGINAEHTL
jgi:uncharacterized protein YidB (DUF937 family)